MKIQKQVNGEEAWVSTKLMPGDSLSYSKLHNTFAFCRPSNKNSFIYNGPGRIKDDKYRIHNVNLSDPRAIVEMVADCCGLDFEEVKSACTDHLLFTFKRRPSKASRKAVR